MEYFLLLLAQLVLEEPSFGSSLFTFLAQICIAFDFRFKYKCIVCKLLVKACWNLLWKLTLNHRQDLHMLVFISNLSCNISFFSCFFFKKSYFVSTLSFRGNNLQFRFDYMLSVNMFAISFLMHTFRQQIYKWSFHTVLFKEIL